MGTVSELSGNNYIYYYVYFMFKGRNPQKMAPNHESFLISASSDAERQEWIKAIRKVMFASIGGG